MADPKKNGKSSKKETPLTVEQMMTWLRNLPQNVEGKGQYPSKLSTEHGGPSTGGGRTRDIGRKRTAPKPASSSSSSTRKPAHPADKLAKARKQRRTTRPGDLGE